jgi:peptidoglycan/xylan/chitin deacetylase (PgdA/CDA1 family)
MNWEQVKALIQEPLCTIGGHTVSHVALNKLSLEELDNEITSGINIIQAHTDYKPVYFAYPYGSEKENGEREYNYIKNSNIKMAFISYGGFVFPDCTLEHVPRFMLK